MKRFLGVLLLIVLLFGVCSCKEEEPPAAEEGVFFTVTYITSQLPYDVTPPADAKVEKGAKASVPTLDAAPTAGYVVIWTIDVTKKTAYDFSAAVEGDLTLYAVEVPRTYQVIYILDPCKNVKANPTSFTKATETIYLADAYCDFGYKFVKWAYYDDPESEVAAIVTGTEGDVVLRAVVTPADYEITYLEEGENPNPKTYRFGDTLSLESPSREGYRFCGYTIGGDADNTPVPTTLTAEFILANQEKLFKLNGTICLQANWEAE